VPSPLAHAGLGYAVHLALRNRGQRYDLRRSGPFPLLALALVCLSLLPDLDAVAGMVTGDMRRFHNTITHSLAFGLLVSSAIGGAVWLRWRSGFRRWFGLALLCHVLHMITDLASTGRGLMVLWPLSSARYKSPVKVFYGVRWPDGWRSRRHAWTVATELGSLVAAAGIIRLLPRVSTRLRGILRPQVWP